MALKRVAVFTAALALLCLVPSTVSAEPTFFVRGVYGRDSSATGVDVMKSSGFNSVTVMPWRPDLDALQSQGLKGVVWLFGYSNETCAFERDDAWIRDVMSRIAGHPAVLAYQITDEPDAYKCPGAPAAVRARAQLVKSLDPSKPTYIVVSAWDGREAFPYENFVGATDIMGLDVYPCGRYRWEYPNDPTPPCKFEDIDAAIAEARKDGVARFWAVMQDFSDDWYRAPTASELRTQFDRWADSGMEGYFVYHWNWGNIESKADHLSVLREQNARTFGGTTITTPVAPVADTTGPTAPQNLRADVVRRSVTLRWDASTDNDAVAGYRVARDGTGLGTTTDLSFNDVMGRSRKYVYEVRAFDRAGNFSAPASLTITNPRSNRTALWTRQRLRDIRA